MTFKSILTSSVMMGMLLTPLAAQAGTRTASLARPTMAQSALSDGGARKSLTVRRENGIAMIPLFFLIAAGIGGTAAVTSAIVKDDNKSRGAS